MIKTTKLSFKEKQFEFLENLALEANLPLATYLRVEILKGLEVPSCQIV